MKPLFLVTWPASAQALGLKLLPLVREAAKKLPGLTVRVTVKR